MKPIHIGTRIHCILYGGRDGTVVAIHGEARPETIINFPGLTTGGNAEYDIVWDTGTRSMRIPECIARGVQWHLLDEDRVAPEEIPALLAKAADFDTKAKQAEIERQAAKAGARQRMLLDHPELTPCEDEKGAAKNIRIELRTAFPGIKFSVCCGRGSISVGWTDGPTTDEVTDITGSYQAGRFDGMTDCYEYNHDRAWPFGEGRYIFESRTMSDESRDALTAAIAEAYDTDEWEQQRLRHQIYGKTSLPAGHVVTGIKWKDDEGHVGTHEKNSQSPATTA